MFWGFDGDCRTIDTALAAKLRTTYLGLVAEVDHHFGRLINWLDQSGQANDTLVVVTADHGEMLGDHGMWGKDNVLDPAYHVPLMIRFPGRPAKIVEALTESVDVTPTILDWLAGDLPPPFTGIRSCRLPGRTHPRADATAPSGKSSSARPVAHRDSRLHGTRRRSSVVLPFCESGIGNRCISPVACHHAGSENAQCFPAVVMTVLKLITTGLAIYRVTPQGRTDLSVRASGLVPGVVQEGADQWKVTPRLERDEAFGHFKRRHIQPVTSNARIVADFRRRNEAYAKAECNDFPHRFTSRDFQHRA